MPDQNNDMQPDVSTGEGAEEGAGKGKKGLSRMLLTILPLVLLPAAAGAYLAYSQFPALAEAAVSAGFNFGIAEEPEEEKPIVYGQFTTINDLLINPAGTDGKRFLVISIGLETKSGDVIAELEQKDIVVRDAILRLLSSYTDAELASIQLRGRLKDEILSELNRILQKGEIDRLYFTQYLLQ